MKEMTVNYSNKIVKIQMGENLLSEIKFPSFRKYLIITDENVGKLYLEQLLEKLPNALYRILPAGEESKSLGVVEELLEHLLVSSYTKGDVLIAFGGGVITDLVGFVASIYKRGMRFICIPTSLLAQVDSALGGKTGINFSANNLTYKNQIGTIYHPELVLVDPSYLKTLPEAELRSGMGEIIKYGLCFDPILFNSLFKDFKLSDLIYRSLEIKAAITARDEFESGERMLLNYGHTVGHALESLSGFKLRHGEAVALGMLLETEDKLIQERLETLLAKFSFPEFRFSRSDLIAYLKQDKKIRMGKIKLPVLKAIGKLSLEEIELAEYLGRF
ncbi:MAG TPA: 3-dehydroquinate synthase [Acholeplasmataceae bacterium]|jgi:3-dehydroquinate synthase|nr:3-dehydroquinate synthase [Acholeplasmataceae bacterium]